MHEFEPHRISHSLGWIPRTEAVAIFELVQDRPEWSDVTIYTYNARIRAGETCLTLRIPEAIYAAVLAAVNEYREELVP